MYCHYIAKGLSIQIRVSAEEKVEIERRAEAAGLKVSDYARRLMLGRALPTTIPPALPPDRKAAPVEAEKVRAEVAESKLQDDPARDEFVARRTLQLKGAGNTTQVAARMAREEWEAR